MYLLASYLKFFPGEKYKKKSQQLVFMSSRWSNHCKRASLLVILWAEVISSAGQKLLQVHTCLLQLVWQSSFFFTLPWLIWGKIIIVQWDITLPTLPVSLLAQPFQDSYPHWTVHIESVIFFSLPWFSVQWILSIQATIDLVIGYNPPSAPHPNDPSGTSVSGMGGKLTFLVTQGESAKAHRVSKETAFIVPISPCPLDRCNSLQNALPVEGMLEQLPWRTLSQHSSGTHRLQNHCEAASVLWFPLNPRLWDSREAFLPSSMRHSSQRCDCRDVFSDTRPWTFSFLWILNPLSSPKHPVLPLVDCFLQHKPLVLLGHFVIRCHSRQGQPRASDRALSLR